MGWASRTFLAQASLGATSILFSIGLLLAAAGPTAAEVTEKSSASYNKAMELVESGKLKAAVIELKNALQEDPADSESRLLLGNVYVLLGDGAAAEDQFKAAERHGMNSERVVVPLGRALLLQGRFKEVLGGFDPQGRSPDIALDLRHLRAEAQIGLGQLSEARATYKEIKKDSTEDARIPLGLARIDLAERKFDVAETQAAAALALNPELADATLVRAEALREMGNPDRAEPLYRDLIDRKQLSLSIRVPAHIGLITALIALNRDADAEAEIATLRSLVPDAPMGAYLAAVIKVRAQDFAAARNLLEGSAPGLEEYVPAYFLFGVVYFSAGEFATAASWLSRHLRARPDNLATRKLLGAALLRVNTIPDAITVLEPGLAQAPDDPQILLLLGSAKMRGGRPGEAAELLKRAAELSPADPRVLGQLAISQMAIGQSEEALAALDATLDLGTDVSVLGFALAFSHLRKGEFDAALTVAQKLRQSLSDSPVAANLEGAALAGLGRPDDARAAFEAALKLDPHFHEARANLAALKVKAGNLDEAETDYLKLLDQDKTNAAAMIGLASIERRRGNASASRRWLEKAVEANPQSIDVTILLAEDHVSAGQMAAALDLLTSLAREYPTSGRVLYALGRLQLQAGRAADAVSTYRRLAEASGGSADVRIFLAQSHKAAGDAAKARRVLEDSLADHPGHRPSIDALVRLVEESEGPEASVAYVEQLRRRFPDASWVNALLGDLYWRAGRLEEALAAYEKAWAQEPSAALALALSRVRDAQTNDKVAALVPLQQWLAAHPSDVAIQLELGKTQLALGDLAAARATYESLKATQANNPIVWNNLAWLYQRLDDQRAIEHGERALELAPQQPEIMDTLGWILLDEGQTERATSLLRQAHQAAPDDPDIGFHYAAALHRGGDDAAAKQMLQSLLKESRSFSSLPEAKALLEKLAP